MKITVVIVALATLCGCVNYTHVRVEPFGPPILSHGYEKIDQLYLDQWRRTFKEIECVDGDEVGYVSQYELVDYDEPIMLRSKDGNYTVWYGIIINIVTKDFKIYRNDSNGRIPRSVDEIRHWQYVTEQDLNKVIGK